jgi:hypothetical protein
MHTGSPQEQEATVKLGNMGSQPGASFPPQHDRDLHFGDCSAVLIQDFGNRLNARSSAELSFGPSNPEAVLILLQESRVLGQEIRFDSAQQISHNATGINLTRHVPLSQVLDRDRPMDTSLFESDPTNACG